MEEQLKLIEDALRKARGASLGGMPLDISVSRQYGDSTVTLRSHLPTKGGSSAPVGLSSLGSLDTALPEEPQMGVGVGRRVSTASFFGEDDGGGAGIARADMLGGEIDAGDRDGAGVLRRAHRLARASRRDERRHEHKQEVKEEKELQEEQQREDRVDEPTLGEQQAQQHDSS